MNIWRKNTSCTEERKAKQTGYYMQLILVARFALVSVRKKKCLMLEAIELVV